MAYTVKPAYGPPVNSVKVRDLWERTVGLNGRLSGLAVTDNEFIATIGDGSFISNGCVINVRDAIVDLADAGLQPINIYGYYDESNGDGKVVVSRTPKTGWALLATKWEDSWSSAQSVATIGLRPVAVQHIVTDTHLHITEDQKNALSVESNPSAINPFLTEADAAIGSFIVPSGLAIGVNSVGGNSSSSLMVNSPAGNIVIEGVAGYKTGGSFGGARGLVDRMMYIIEANGRWFPDTFSRTSIDTAAREAYVSNLGIEEIASAGPNTDEYVRATILNEGFSATMVWGGFSSGAGESQIGIKIPMIFIRADSGVSSVELECPGALTVEKTVIKNPAPGKWIPIVSKISPDDSVDVNGVLITIKGGEGAVIDVSGVSCVPLITIKKEFDSVVDLPSAISVSPMGMVDNPDECLNIHIEPLNRSDYINPAFTNKAPDSISSNEEYIKASLVMAGNGGLFSKAATEWDSNRRDYCISDSKDTGLSYLIGGNDGGGALSSIMAYSPNSDSVITIDADSSINPNKSGLAVFESDMIITGGDYGGATDDVYSLCVASNSISVKTSLLESRKNHGSVAIGENKALIWMGDETDMSHEYNLATDSWKVMPDVMPGAGPSSGSFYGGVRSINRQAYSEVDIAAGDDNVSDNVNACILVGAGEAPGSTGGKVDLVTNSYSNLGLDNLVSGSNIGITGFGVALFQSEESGDARLGCLDMISLTERSIDMPTSGKGGCGNSMHRDESMSLGPWESFGEFFTEHNIFSYCTPFWLSGAVIKWED